LFDLILDQLITTFGCCDLGSLYRIFQRHRISHRFIFILLSVSAGMLMENSARLYHCARCRRQVIVCRFCDRGQIYCTGSCAKLARTTSLRAAGQRYRQTRLGKLKQALRQQRYRRRLRLRQPQKVTHHRSLLEPPHDLLTPTVKRTRRRVAQAKDQEMICHFCGRCGWIFLRLGFLRRFSQVNASSLPQGPPGCTST